MKRFFVIGNPIAHSLSPQIHEMFARQTGIELSYGRKLFTPGRFGEELRALIESEGPAGANVTVPFKLDAAGCSTVLGEAAVLAGAVNTLSFGGDGIRGDNTDGTGFVRDVTGRFATALAGSRVLVLGAGGAVRGIIGPIKEAGCASIAVANRTFEKAQRLAADFGIEPLRYPETAGRRFDIIVNGTSASITREAPPVVREVFANAVLAYDLFYSRTATPFMELASSAGCPLIADGLGMLVEQAAESFRIWNGVLPETQAVYETLRDLP